MEDAAPRADIYVTTTGNLAVITLEHMRKMRNRAIVSNIGHFDSNPGDRLNARRQKNGDQAARDEMQTSRPATASFC